MDVAVIDSSTRTARYPVWLQRPVARAMEWLPRPLDARLHGVLKRALLLHGSGVYECRTRDDVVMICDARDMLQSRILHFGVWEPGITAVLKACLEADDTMIDVGANIGYDSLFAARIVGPSGAIVAVEASSKIAALLRRNIALNDAGDRITVIQKAVTEAPTTLNLYEGPAGNIGATTADAVRGGALHDVVEGLPLHDMLTAQQLATARVMKMDVEGFEVPVLANILANIDRYPQLDTLLVELSDRYDEAAALLDRFAVAGFRLFTVDNDYRSEAYLRDQGRPVIKPMAAAPRQQTDLLLIRDAALDVRRARLAPLMH